MPGPIQPPVPFGDVDVAVPEKRDEEIGVANAIASETFEHEPGVELSLPRAGHSLRSRLLGGPGYCCGPLFNLDHELGFIGHVLTPGNLICAFFHRYFPCIAAKPRGRATSAIRTGEGPKKRRPPWELWPVSGCMGERGGVAGTAATQPLERGSARKFPKLWGAEAA